MTSRVRHRIQPGDGDPRHGTNNGYRNLHCRCDDCRTANTAYNRARTGRRTLAEWRAVQAATRNPTHGRIATYVKGCRCDDCRRVASAKRADRRRRVRAAQQRVET